MTNNSQSGASQSKLIPAAFSGVALGFLALCAAYVPLTDKTEPLHKILQSIGLTGFIAANTIGLVGNMAKVIGKESPFSRCGENAEETSQKAFRGLLSSACGFFAADNVVAMAEQDATTWQQLTLLGSSVALGISAAASKKYVVPSLLGTAAGVAGLAAPAIFSGDIDEPGNQTIIASCAAIAVSAITAAGGISGLFSSKEKTKSEEAPAAARMV